MAELLIGSQPDRVLFEPWSLGDVLIAASVFRHHSSRSVSLACSERWIPLLTSAFHRLGIMPPHLIPVELAYTRGKRQSRWSSGPNSIDGAQYPRVREVLSIRGDPRDWISARRLFPLAKLKFTGWTSFVARRNRALNIPYRLGAISVRNRYQAWNRLMGAIDSDEWSTPGSGSLHWTYMRQPKILIHIGAQWASRQYPYFGDLYQRLKAQGFLCRIVAGPGDQSFVELSSELEVLSDGDLVEAILDSDLCLTNDSGPMHLSSFLGKRTIAISRVSDIREWLPPGARAVCSEMMPRGYRPDSRYCSHDRLWDWPNPKFIEEEILRISSQAAPRILFSGDFAQPRAAMDSLRS